MPSNPPYDDDWSGESINLSTGRQRGYLPLKEWAFARYRYGVLMAEGARVHAKTEAEALQKAQDLFSDERGITTFKLRIE